MIDDAVAKETLHRALSSGGEFAEIFAESRVGTSARLDGGKVEQVITGLDRGVGVRVIRGRAQAYAHTNRLDRQALLDAAATAAAAVPGDGQTEVRDLRREPERTLASVQRPPDEVASTEKVDVLRRIDDTARGKGAEIIQVTSQYADARQEVFIANSEGTVITDHRVRTFLFCLAVAMRDGVVMTGHRSTAGTVGFELFERHSPEEVAETAAVQALTMLDARPAPAGEMPVVLAPGGGGVLLHEACGHGLEADGIEKGTSIYAGKLGEKVGSDLVNAVDDATLPGEWGSFAYDDEGTPSHQTSIFEGGVLTSYLADRLRAKLLDVEPTGNGRRQSYAHTPVPRMTNTFMSPGESDPETIVQDVKQGLFAKSFSGGQVDPASGNFVFGLSEAYLVENGEITHPVRGANLVGNGVEVLQRIDAVGNDFDLWVGMCGKEGQMVPVNVGLPTIRVSRITVGGTQG